MDYFTDTNQIKSKKVVIIPPLYNNDKTLEFLIQPEKHLFYPNEVYLHFSIEIPAAYLMDNQVADKLFDSLEVQLNNSKISNNSSSNEYFLAAYFNVRSNYPSDVLTTSMVPMGYHGNLSFDSAYLNSLDNINKPLVDPKLFFDPRFGSQTSEFR